MHAVFLEIRRRKIYLAEHFKLLEHRSVTRHILVDTRSETRYMYYSYSNHYQLRPTEDLFNTF